MSSPTRTAALLTAFIACSSATFAATPKEIDAAIKKGTEALKAKYAGGMGVAPVVGPDDAGHGIGSTCLAGLALLEAGVPVADPAIKTITGMVRGAAYRQTKTYQVSLCLMYLDRLGDPTDVPLIQALAVRLLVGQNSQGGWGYDSIGEVTKGDEERLRAMKPGAAGKLHPDVEEYAKSLMGRRGGATAGAIGIDDNSNTQFAVLAVWLARKHGVPVDNALDLIERRFVASQLRNGNWSYTGPAAAGGGVATPGSPSMYCAGLISLATGVARRDEKKPERKEELKTDPGKEPPKKSDDPFFNPPKKDAKEPPKKKESRPLTATDRAIQAAFTGLGAHLAESAQAGRGALAITRQGQLGGHGRHDLYFCWSLERVGVIYGVEKIGGVDWYEAGAHSLVHTQSPDGSWNISYGAEVDTSFAVLFLCRSNLARDLSGKVQKETATEMKAGTIPGLETKQTEPVAGTTNPNPAAPPIVLPGPTGSQAAVMVGELLRAPEKDWSKVLEKLRDSKGTVHTQALLGAVSRLEGDRRKAAREALAERLTRMNAATLREMVKYEDPELRRAAVLAMAMKDDKAHIPDLIAAILDEEDMVVRAARAGLKSLTNGEDFGPAANAPAGEKLLAERAWKAWLGKQK
jgi:hypothetical protein